jgi:hypothetical protein
MIEIDTRTRDDARLLQPDELFGNEQISIIRIVKENASRIPQGTAVKSCGDCSQRRAAEKGRSEPCYGVKYRDAEESRGD